jgi:proteasome lid subunit RPN8/RPN11
MLRISRKNVEAIFAQAEHCYPQECCGVLLGTLSDGVRVVSEAIPAENVSKGLRSTRYSIAPQELIAIQKRARDSALDIIGFYHSHPDHPAQWSDTDRREAHWFACSYLIVSVEDGKAAELHSFVLAGTSEEDKRFDDEELQIEDSVSL